MTSFMQAVMPTRISIAFTTDGALHGAMSIFGQSGIALTFTLILQADGETRSYDLDGDGRFIGVTFKDAEAFIILARRSGAIVASGIFEIDVALSGVGQLLIPRALNNLIVTQELQVPPRTSPLVAEAVQA